MGNDVYKLPEFLTHGNNSDTSIHFYETDRSSVKNKVVFTQNLICFIQQGQKEVYTTNCNTWLNEQQLFLLPAGSVLMSESIAKDDRFKSLLIFFSDKFLVDFCMKYNVEAEHKNPQKGEIMALEKDAFIGNYASSLQLLPAIQNDHLLQSVKLEELLLYMLRNWPNKMNFFIGDALLPKPQLKMKQTVLHNIDKTLSVEEIAFLCSMSLSTFKRHFSEIFKTSPKKYFTEHRMKKAKLMLKRGERPSDIFWQLGYEDLSAFSSEFKKHFAISPSQFQKEFEPKEKVFEPTEQV